MNYQEFKTMLKDRMQEIMGDSIEVTYETYTKNNQTKIEAMIFKEKEPQARTLLSPSIHLQDLYELYEENGESKEFDDCLHQIKVLYQNQESKNFECFDGDWEEIRNSICLSLVNEAWNRKWLEEEQISYCKFLDFAIILRRTLDVSSRGVGTMVITKEFMDYMDVSEEVFWDTAWSNFYQEKFCMYDMNDVVRLEAGKSGKSINTSDLKRMPPMYIISNQEREHGARAILRTDLLQKFSRELDCNLYILPSSVHEIILMPDTGIIDVQKMREDVKSINETVVPEYEWLSNEVYYFRKDRGTVEIAE